MITRQRFDNLKISFDKEVYVDNLKISNYDY